MSTVRAEPIVVEADPLRADHAAAIVKLLGEYACHTMGRGSPLAPEVLARLSAALAEQPGSHIFLAYSGETPIGVATCFLGFSTFAASPLLNVHDLAVSAAWRGQGVGRMLLGAAEQKARTLGCCRLTLEVRADNERATHVYRQFGFKGGEPEAYHFLTKQLD
jgi:GNAT superfamily N-acetyltransferase